MTAAPRPLATDRFYPQRADAPEPAADRLLAGLGFRLRNRFARRLPAQEARDAAVRRHFRRFRDAPLAPRLAELRYSLRRDSLGAEAVAECHAWYGCAMAAHGAALPAPHVLGAADRLIAGGIVELADPAERLHALGLAAAAYAAYGAPVHIVTASDASAKQLAAQLAPAFASLGLAVGSVAEGMSSAARREAYALPVVCAASRQIASDYLQDQLKAGQHLRALSGRLGSLEGAAAGEGLLLRGLSCALVHEADWVMLEDAAAPVVVSAEADRSRERLVYEQALELARALEEDAEFTLAGESARLTPAGAQRLDRLLAPLGGVWQGRARRHGLIETALAALHLRQRERDYRVDNQRVVFPEPQAGEDEDAEAELRGMIELKEGCRLSAQRNVLARLPMQRLFRRYLHLAGTCADARGLEAELWSAYSLATVLAGPRRPPAAVPRRAFATAGAKHHALLARARSAGARGEALLVALRSPREAQATVEFLGKAGIACSVLRGTGGDGERQALAALDTPGGVALVLPPAESRILRAAGKVPLHVVAAEAQDPPRQVRRICEAFAAASCEALLSLEDESVAQLCGALALAGLRRAAREELPAVAARWLAATVQRRAGRARALAREESLQRERYLGDLLAFSGSRD